MNDPDACRTMTRASTAAASTRPATLMPTACQGAGPLLPVRRGRLRYLGWLRRVRRRATTSAGPPGITRRHRLSARTSLPSVSPPMPPPTAAKHPAALPDQYTDWDGARADGRRWPSQPAQAGGARDALRARGRAGPPAPSRAARSGREYDEAGVAITSTTTTTSIPTFYQVLRAGIPHDDGGQGRLRQGHAARHARRGRQLDGLYHQAALGFSADVVECAAADGRDMLARRRALANGSTVSGHYVHAQGRRRSRKNGSHAIDERTSELFPDALRGQLGRRQRARAAAPPASAASVVSAGQLPGAHPPFVTACSWRGGWQDAAAADNPAACGTCTPATAPRTSTTDRCDYAAGEPRRTRWPVASRGGGPPPHARASRPTTARCSATTATRARPCRGRVPRRCRCSARARAWLRAASSFLAYAARGDLVDYAGAALLDGATSRPLRALLEAGVPPMAAPPPAYVSSGSMPFRRAARRAARSAAAATTTASAAVTEATAGEWSSRSAVASSSSAAGRVPRRARRHAAAQHDDGVPAGVLNATADAFDMHPIDDEQAAGCARSCRRASDAASGRARAEELARAPLDAPGVE